MVTQLEQRREVGSTVNRIPLTQVDDDLAMRSLGINNVNAVGRDNCQVDLVDPLALLELEVVDDNVVIGQLVAQPGDGAALRVVDRQPDGDDLGHHAPPALMACSTILMACSSSSSASK